MTAISAVYRNGQIILNSPLPADWPEDQPLLIEPVPTDADGPLTEAEIAAQLALMDAIPASTWTDADQAAFDQALVEQKAYQLATWDEQCRKIEEAFP